jgi:hypothetical protein
MKTAVLGALALSLGLAGTARAQTIPETPPPGGGAAFGGAGQVSIAGDFSIGFTHNSDSDLSSFVLAPALDYFIIPQLSLGGQIRFGYASVGNTSTTNFGIGPRVGFNIPLGAMFSFYPRAGFDFQHVGVSIEGGGSDSYNLLSLFLFAPFLWHPVPHFYIGLGPFMDGGIAGERSARTFTFGLNTTVGGWFDWL